MPLLRRMPKSFLPSFGTLPMPAYHSTSLPCSGVGLLSLLSMPSRMETIRFWLCSLHMVFSCSSPQRMFLGLMTLGRYNPHLLMDEQSSTHFSMLGCPIATLDTL